VQVVAEELVRLSRALLDSSVSVAEDWSGSHAALNVPDSAAGDTAQGSALVATAVSLAEAADLAVGRLVAVLQEDADDVVRLAFEVSVVDDDAARRFAGETEPRRTGAS
jgi:hypothetical protein